MYLFLSIFLSIVLGYFLLMMGPLFGGVVAFGIIAGSLFRGVYLLNDIRKRLASDSPVEKEVQEQQVTEVVPEHLKSPGAYKKYLEGKEERGL